MHALRAFLSGHGRIAILVVALALCMKVLLPAGYMLSSAAGGDSTRILVLTLCNAGDDSPAVARIALPGKDKGHEAPTDHGKADGQCAYSALSMAAMGGASAPLLALAFAVILALGLAPARRLPFGRIAHLRPPLRGPPATA